MGCERVAQFSAHMCACTRAPVHLNIGMDTVLMFKYIDRIPDTDGSNSSTYKCIIMRHIATMLYLYICIHVSVAFCDI
jgi:hypothetical protein